MIGKIEKITKQLLEEIGEDPNREGLIKTPHRVSKAWEFFSKGYKENLNLIINGAIFEEDARDMVIVRDIEFFSLCEHHLIPFFGKAHVGYIPNGKVIGLSKIPRIIDMFSCFWVINIDRFSISISKISGDALSAVTTRHPTKMGGRC